MISEIKKIEKLIEKGKLFTAIEKSLCLTDETDTNLKNVAILLSARLNTLEAKKGKGIITQEELRVEENKITLDLLQLLEDIQNAVVSKKIKKATPKKAIGNLSKKPSRIFLHFFDHYFLEMKSRRNNWTSSEFKESQLATRLALLAADEILIPASSYFESPLCRKVIDEFKDIFDTGMIWLVSKALSLNDYSDNKLEEYVASSKEFKFYSNICNLTMQCPPFLTRKNSATKDIVQSWKAIIETEFIEIAYDDIGDGKTVNNLEKKWLSIPDKLGSLAFVAKHVKPLFFPKEREIQNKVDNFLLSTINQFYFKSFTDELEAGIVDGMVYLNTPFYLYSNGANLLFSETKQSLIINNLYKEVINCPVQKILLLKQDNRIKNALKMRN